MLTLGSKTPQKGESGTELPEGEGSRTEPSRKGERADRASAKDLGQKEWVLGRQKNQEVGSHILGPQKTSQPQAAPLFLLPLILDAHRNRVTMR